MGKTLSFSILDVFAEQRLSGNQLCVVHDAAALSDKEMQAIALETNFSETTFVTGRGDATASVRIFTPVQELPFAGHPTIGTAWDLAEGVGTMTLELRGGPVTVEFADGIGWLKPPEVKFTGSLDADRAAALIGLPGAAIAHGLPVELADIGPKFVLIPLQDRIALQAVEVNGQIRKQMLSEGIEVHSIFLFTADAHGADADFAARMFFDAGGLREDPATGSANAVFAAYLQRHRGELGEVVVDQGVEMRRPSRLYLMVGRDLLVGGKVQKVAAGELYLD